MIKLKQIAQSGASLNDNITWNGSEWIPQAGGGGGFTAGGDLSGSSTSQTVEALKAMGVPDAATASIADALIVVDSNSSVSPRSAISDGSEIWIGDHQQSQTLTGLVTRYNASSGTPPFLSVGASVDLTAIDSNIEGIRDLAIDSNYVYATGWDSGTIAIISRTTNAIVGWGTMYAVTLIGARAKSVAADGAGKFYVLGRDNDGDPVLLRFDASACIGATPGGPGLQGPEASTALANDGRKLRYGNGDLFIASGGWDDALRKHDPSTLLETGRFVGDGGGYSCIYAFGSVWVTDLDLVGPVVYRVNPTTMGQEAAVAMSISDAQGISVGPDDVGTANSRIYVSDFQAGAVGIIDPTSNLEETTVSFSRGTTDEIAAFENAAFVTSRKNTTDPGDGVIYSVLGDSSSFTAGGPLTFFTLEYASTSLGPASGDLSGTYPGPMTVTGLQTETVASGTPNADEVLTYSGGQWQGLGVLQSISQNDIPYAGASGSVGAISPTPAVSGEIPWWDGFLWYTAQIFTGLTLNAIPTVGASGAPQSLVGSASGDVPTWNGSQWVAQGASSSNPLEFTVLSSASNPPGYPGASVVLRSDGTSLYAVRASDDEIAEAYATASPVTVTSFEATPPAPTGPYPMDACAIETRDSRIASGFCAAYAYGSTTLRIRKFSATWSAVGATPSIAAETPLDITVTGEPSFVSCCSTAPYLTYTQETVVVAFVVGGVGYVTRVDVSTNPPTASTPIAFNDKNGTITAVAIGMEPTPRNNEAVASVFWGVASDDFGEDRVYTRFVARNASAGTSLSLATTGSLTNNTGPGASSIPISAQYNTISPWLRSGSAEDVNISFGREGVWHIVGAYLNTGWPSARYLPRDPLVRIDGPHVDAGAAGYIIDAAQDPRPNEGCFLDSTRHASIVWGSKNGYDDSAYLCVSELAEHLVSVRSPKVVGDTIGDPQGLRHDPPRLRAACCKRMTDKGFIFGAYNQRPDLPTAELTVGQGYMRDGDEFVVSYNFASGVFVYDPIAKGAAQAYDWQDDRQRAVPVRLADSFFVVVACARVGSTTGVPQWVYTEVLDADNHSQVIGISTETPSGPGASITVQAFGGVMSGYTGLTEGAWYHNDNYSLKGGGYAHPGWYKRFGIALTSTSMIVVPPSR